MPELLQSQDSPAPARVKILIVDDLTEKHLALRSVLSDLGQEIVSVYSGREALRAVLEHDFALILLDVNMPDMDGMETATLLRQYKRTATTPILFITAYGDELTAVRGYSLGAVDFIPSPVIPEVLRSKVRVFVDLHRMTVELREQATAREALARAEAARQAAESASRRADFLAAASKGMGRSLDLDTTLEALLSVVVPSLAETALLVRPNPDRSLRSIRLLEAGSAAGAQSAGIPGDGGGLIEAEARDLSPALLAAIEAALVGREPVMLGPLPLWASDDLIDPARAGSPAAPATVAYRLSAQEAVIGILVLRRPLGTPFTEPELALVREVVSRAEIALDNAALYREVQDADRRKNEFLAMLAHELRNPLAPIRNAVHILQRGGMDPEHTNWARDVIGRQTDHMARLIDDLLDVSRIAQGKVIVNMELIDWAQVAERAIESVKPAIEARGQTLEVDLPQGPVTLRGDLVRLAQVLGNLLNNAAKFTPGGGTIRLAARIEESRLKVSVSDNGNGIDPQLLPFVFDLFTQGDQSLDRAEGGLGIGLTLVRHLVSLHRGTVEARSPGRGLGSEFIVTLPVERVCLVPEAPPEERGEHSAVAAAKVLIVDDQPSSLESLKRLFELEGHRVQTAADGRLALSVASNFKPDVVILDIGLPGMTGFQVAKAIREDPELSDPLLIALTGYGREDDRVRAQDAGFDHHFVKPANIPSLLSVIEAHVALRRLANRRPEAEGGHEAGAPTPLPGHGTEVRGQH